MKPAFLGFGAMRLPTDTTECKKMVSAYLDSGGNYFDTAYVYGGSEEMLKRALVSRHPRDKYMLANKVPPWSVKSIADCDRILQTSLKRCGTDYFDYYLLHALGKDGEKKATSIGMYEWAQEMKKKGLVRHVGFSFHDNAELLEEILAAHPEMEFVMLQLNYVDIMRGPAGEFHKLALKYDKPILAMEPVKGGTLAKLPASAESLLKSARPDASVASWAMRYAASLEGVKVVLSGMSTLKQVEDNNRTFNPFEPINTEEYSILEKAVEILGKEASIPCTGCKYCMSECPQCIEIASCIAIYNEYIRNDDSDSRFNRKMMYDTIIPGKRAGDCNSCGVCLKYCVQGFDVPAALKTVAKEFAS